MKVWPPATCATATENRASAAASLIRLSPVRIAMTRFGSPSLRPTATAVTASGGATMAPSTSAVPNVSGTTTIQDDTAGDRERGDDHQADAQAEDRFDVAQERREREVQRRRVQQRRQHDAEQDVRVQFGRLEPGQERHRDADDDDDQRRFQPAAVRDGGDHDGADDDEDQFHARIVAANARAFSPSRTSGRESARRARHFVDLGGRLGRALSIWQVGHQNRLRPSSSTVRTVVPHTRHGSPARR